MSRRGAGTVLLAATFAAMVTGPGVALAQAGSEGGSVISVPEAPAVSSVPTPTMPDDALPAPDLPGSVVAPAAPAGRRSGAASPGKTQGSVPAGPPAQIEPVWDPRKVAILDVLDKADGAVSRVSAPVGSSFTEGRLKVAIGACVVRPDHMAPDAAVYMTVNTAGEGDDGGKPSSASAAREAPLFRGWLIRSEPGATVVGDAAVTFRLIGCTAG